MTRLAEFKLERWFARYEFQVDYNLAASCPWNTTTAELLSLAGEEARERYLSLALGYIPSLGTNSLRQTLAAQYANVQSDQVQVTTGASEAILLLVMQLAQAGDNVVVQSPIYQSFMAVAEYVGAEVRQWPLRPDSLRPFGPDSAWSSDPDLLSDLIDDNTRMVVINVPNSPTGAMPDPAVLQEIIQLCEHRGIVLVVDEVYRGVSLHGEPTPPSPVDLSEAAVVIGDITKPYGLGGLRVGWMASQNRPLLRHVAKARDYTTMCSAAPSEFLAEIAVRHGEGIIAEKVAGARANLQTLKEFTDGHGKVLEWVDPQGGYTIFAKLNSQRSTEAFCAELAEIYGTLLLPGNVFEYEGYVRIGLGARPAEFQAGLERLSRCIA